MHPPSNRPKPVAQPTVRDRPPLGEYAAPGLRKRPRNGSVAGMFLSTQARPGRLRTLLVLGRVSNLPTVWSNCLAGWILGGGGSVWRLALVTFATTCLYVGGMYWNDAFDVQFDRQHRKERPIPSGAISVQEVWGWGAFWLLTGALALALLGLVPAILGLVLAGCIVLYDAIHKAVTFSPVLMATCRFLVYLVAASATAAITGLAIWSGLALAVYVVGLSYIARKESVRGVLSYWPSYLLAAPVLLAFIVNEGLHWTRSIPVAVILVAWTLYCLRFTYRAAERNVGRTVAGLLAGIVWVDLLAVVGAAPQFALMFAGLFVAALLFQRFVPAT